MLSEETLAGIAEDLAAAARHRTALPRLTQRFPGMSVEDAYRVQQLWCRGQEADGRVRAGHKIGLTSRAMQQATGITEPDYGVLFADMILDSGARIDTELFAYPRIEVELAFSLQRELAGPHATLVQVLDATAYVLPALEILDSRLELAGRTIVDTISDNAAVGALVVGGRPVRPDAVDLRWVAALLALNGGIVETGVAAGVLNHPATGVAWLANRLARHGETLRAGELILSGSFTRPLAVAPGDTVTADYGPLGALTCLFT